jgi:hypothetical protein
MNEFVRDMESAAVSLYNKCQLHYQAKQNPHMNFGRHTDFEKPQGKLDRVVRQVIPLRCEDDRTWEPSELFVRCAKGDHPSLLRLAALKRVNPLRNVELPHPSRQIRVPDLVDRVVGSGVGRARVCVRGIFERNEFDGRRRAWMFVYVFQRHAYSERSSG